MRLTLCQPPKQEGTPDRLYMTVYPIRLQLTSISGGLLPHPQPRRRAMALWQEPTGIDTLILYRNPEDERYKYILFRLLRCMLQTLPIIAPYSRKAFSQYLSCVFLIWTIQLCGCRLPSVVKLRNNVSETTLEKYVGWGVHVPGVDCLDNYTI